MLIAGAVLSQEQLAERMYRWGDEVKSNAVEVHVHRLRRAIADACQPAGDLERLIEQEAR